MTKQVYLYVGDSESLKPAENDVLMELVRNLSEELTRQDQGSTYDLMLAKPRKNDLGECFWGPAVACDGIIIVSLAQTKVKENLSVKSAPSRISVAMTGERDRVAVPVIHCLMKGNTDTFLSIDALDDYLQTFLINRFDLRPPASFGRAPARMAAEFIRFSQFFAPAQI